MTAYTDIIIEATGCDPEDADVIEELVRVTHPILGNFSRRELMREARIGKAQMELLAETDPECLDFYREAAKPFQRKEGTTMTTKCEHSASGNGFVFVCDLPAGHKGLHEQRDQLRDRIQTTNWGDDGLAPHATKTVDQTFSKEA